MSALQNEIRFFDALAKEWWDHDGPQAMLHQINPLRVKWIMRHVKLKDLKILDIGCGGGILAESLAEKAAKVTGIDLGSSLIEMAKTHAADSRLAIDYRCIALEEFVQNHQNEFDCVTCLEMLEHVNDFASIIRDISLVLKPDGMVFFSTIDRTPKAFLEDILGAEYVLKLIPKGTHHYDQLIRPDELCRQMRRYGLMPQSMEGLKYHPLLKTFSLKPRLQSNYWIVGQKG